MIQLKQKDVKPLRSKLLKDQNNLCLICKNHINDGCLDHHHKKRIKGSGLIRGVLCSQCNVYLGKIENNAPRYGITNTDLSDRLRSIANYLDMDDLPFIHPSERKKDPILSKRCFNKLKKAYSSDKPNNKQLVYPKSKKLTKNLKQLFIRYGIPIEFNK